MNFEEQRKELRNFILENFDILQLDEMGNVGRTAAIFKHNQDKLRKLVSPKVFGKVKRAVTAPSPAIKGASFYRTLS